MTPLQQHAVARARAGDWQLLDAMELLEWNRSGIACRRIYHFPGEPPIILLGGEVECDCECRFCCHDYDDPEEEEWVTLDGQPAPYTPKGLGMGITEARIMVSDYTRLTESLLAIGSRPAGPLYWWPS